MTKEIKNIDDKWLDKYLVKIKLTMKEAREYAQDLNDHDMLYHIDDDANDIIWHNIKVSPETCDKLDCISNKIQNRARASFFNLAVKL